MSYDNVAYVGIPPPLSRSQRSNCTSPRRPCLFGAAAAAAVAFYLTAMPLSARELSNERVRVIDGDTIVLNKERIRLKGIDAPELTQTCTVGTEVRMCGVQAKDAVVQWIEEAGGHIECQGQGRDRYGRLLAICKIGGKDVGGRLVEEGFAVAYSRYDRQYLPRQERARKAGLYEFFPSVHRHTVLIGLIIRFFLMTCVAMGSICKLPTRGIWSTQFEKPEDFRRRHRIASRGQLHQKEEPVNLNIGTSVKRY